MADETKDPLRTEVERIASEIEEALRGPKGLERGALSAAGVALRTALSAPGPDHIQATDWFTGDNAAPLPDPTAAVRRSVCPLEYHRAQIAAGSRRCPECERALGRWACEECRDTLWLDDETPCPCAPPPDPQGREAPGWAAAGEGT